MILQKISPGAIINIFTLSLCILSFYWSSVITVSRGTGTTVFCESIVERESLNKKTICFHVSTFIARGATRAIYDYAYFSKTLYGADYRIVIIHPEKMQFLEGYDRYNASFFGDIYSYQSDPAEAYVWFGKEESVGGIYMKELVESLCDLLYVLKHGLTTSHPRFPSSFSDRVPTVVHGVFAAESHGPHATVVPLNAYITPNPTPSDRVLPHIVRSPPAFSLRTMDMVLALRNQLSIPRSSFVVCGFGGHDSFSILAASEAVIKLGFRFSRDQLNFIFLGLHPFNSFHHSKFILRDSKLRAQLGIHILPSTSFDERFIEAFIGSCDCMLHARALGETFGLAIAEFSVRNKPVLSYIDPYIPLSSAEHYRILLDKGFYYSNADDIIHYVSDWIYNGIPENDYNAYSKFSPENVMSIFKRLVIDPVFGSVNSARNNYGIGNLSYIDDEDSRQCSAKPVRPQVETKGNKKALLPCKSPHCSVACSKSMNCSQIASTASERCDEYINNFRPPSPLLCNWNDLEFADDRSDDDANISAKFIPIGFAVHSDDILSCIPVKVFDFAISDPMNKSTYIYKVWDESLYRRNMGHSYYSMTHKKAGWDCMRHYEIIASGSMPYFVDLPQCPLHTLPFIPKTLLSAGKHIADVARYAYDSLNRTRQLYRSNFDENGYAENMCCLQRFAEKYLTSTHLADYVLSVSNNTSVKNVLMLFPEDPNRFFDYLSFALLHGLRSTLGAANANHYPSDPLLFELGPGDEAYNELRTRQIWGLGYSWAHRLERVEGNDGKDERDLISSEVLEGIQSHRWDVIIYGAIHRGIPFWDVVKEYYDKEHILVIDGEDFSLDDHATLEANYHPLQWPPFNMRWKELLRSGTYFKRELNDTCPSLISKRDYIRID